MYGVCRVVSRVRLAIAFLLAVSCLLRAQEKELTRRRSANEPSATSEPDRKNDDSPVGDNSRQLPLDNRREPLPIQKTGVVANGEPLARPRVAWRFSPGVGVSDPVVFGGVVFFGDDAGSLHALRARDGVRLWMSGHGHRVFHAPFVDADGIYFTSDRALSAVDRTNGKLLWQHAIDGGGGVPLKVGTSVFAGGSDGVLYAFDAASGTIQWERSLLADHLVDPPGFDGERARIQGTVARPTGCCSDGETFFQSIFDQCRIVAVACATGEERWSFQAGGWIFAHPTVTADRVLVGSQDKHIYCFDKRTGEQIWKFPTRSRVESGAAVRGDAVLIPSCDGNLYRLDLRTGELVWSFRTLPENGRSAIYSRPLIIGDTVCFAAGEGQLYSVDFARGNLIWATRASDQSEMYSSPATDGVRVFVQTRPKNDERGQNAIVAFDEQP